jgi:hypothetical protein
MNPAQLINSSTAPLEERSRAPSSPTEDIGDDSHGGAGVSSLSYAFPLPLRDNVLAEWLRVRRNGVEPSKESATCAQRSVGNAL